MTPNSRRHRRPDERRRALTALGTAAFTILATSTLLTLPGARAESGGGRPSPAGLPISFEAMGSVHGGGAGIGAASQAGLNSQSAEAVERKSAGCLSCHVYQDPDRASMHAANTVSAGCTDCHGGNSSVTVAAGVRRGDRAFDDAQRQAHVLPQLDIWASSANPENVWWETPREDADFIRFNNPGDLRVADQSCGQCHASEVYLAKKSPMRHGSMLWAAALYNNGSFPFKDARFGEFLMPDGTPATAYQNPPPSPEDMRERGILPSLKPLFRWELSQPGNILRIFEQGGFLPTEIGNPDPFEDPGRPKGRLSNRGLGTLNRTDPVFIGLQKTRLMDPTTNFMGSNDRGGDYRSAGCSSCHVIYANDRSVVHSDIYAAAGNEGRAQTSDPMIPNDESGHPINHVLTAGIPTSQCIVCHMHPGANMVTPYTGFTWWDNETDGDSMYPEESYEWSAAERAAIEIANPEGSALRGRWSDRTFLQQTGTQEFNAGLDQAVFADFHGHGWLYKAVFKRDTRGNLLDAASNVVTNVTPQMLWDAVNFSTAGEDPAPPPPGAPVHLKDIHLERGMHCADCHFQIDSHGDGNLYGEARNAIEITCRDCHGTISQSSSLDSTTGAAAPGETGTNLIQTYPGRFFSRRGGRELEQRSVIDDNRRWIIPQISDSLDPSNPRYNERAALAHSIQKDGVTWGGSVPPDDLAHSDQRITCQACHSSWITSCFGCHLTQRANEKRPMLHYEGIDTKNWTQYNFQVLRDDIYMLGIDGSVVGNTISPVRSSSAVVVTSEDLNRNLIYAQQQTISAEGYAGQAFNTHVPHTVRTTETKFCSDCHISSSGDNNAKMAQLLTLGTGMTNFMGRFVWVATGEHGVEAVEVTELSEPQAVIGSDLHRLAYPEEYAEFVANGRQLEHGEHHGSENALDLQHRGEYVYIADGEGGFRVFDMAQLNQKGFSEKIVTAPFSPLGQNTNVSTRFATAVASPTTLGVDPARLRLPENEEQPISLMYAYIYITDREEGLVLSTAATLLDGNPTNNFLERAASFNPNGILDGAVNLTIAGHYAYILCDAGLVIVDIEDASNMRVVGQVNAPDIRDPRAVEVQFRYAFITDADGLKVVDITNPESPRFVAGATERLRDAHGLYLARTFAYVAGGSQGLVIVNIERPERPRIDQIFTAGGELNDARDVKIAMTNASVFAYVADGVNGLRVVQLVSANQTEGAFGFSPRPQPELIATFETEAPALSVSRGLDRDRAVDESGNQLAVFGRRGGRPFNLEEMQRMYLRDGELWTVDDRPPGPSLVSEPPVPAGDAADSVATDDSSWWSEFLDWLRQLPSF